MIRNEPFKISTFSPKKFQIQIQNFNYIQYFYLQISPSITLNFKSHSVFNVSKMQKMKILMQLESRASEQVDYFVLHIFNEHVKEWPRVSRVGCTL